MMETYKSLRKEFDRKVETLRQRCNHPKVGNRVVGTGPFNRL